MKKDLETMRHSCSHVLAQAVKHLHPGVKLGIGPAIENGFHYDFEFKSPISEADLPKIEKEMVKIIKKDLKFVKKEISISEAKNLFKNQPYKLELIDDIAHSPKPRAQSNKITIYTQGNFTDLCAGPHVKSTKEIGPFKLQVVAGAYWKGSEKNPMLTRIYGTCFATQKELDNHLYLLEEAKKRDHRILGEKLDLFTLPVEIGGGLPVWHPKGAILRREIEDFWKIEHEKRNYQLVYSPHIANLDIWKKSGHWNFYRKNMYSPIKIENQEYLIKPMNCPFHIFIYKSQLRSYKELPIKYAELGTVYRYERSGVLHGLTRVRGFTQDDAHIFCREDQLEKEIADTIKFAEFMLKTFGFLKYHFYLSTRPSKSLGTDKMWQEATQSLESALKATKVPYSLDLGEGVFYGPKIDVKIEDALGREWQGPTIQVDFNFPEKFDVTYTDEKGRKKQIVMIHRTVLGSMERFIGLLIEHTAGTFPLWLAPVQCEVINIGSPHKKYAESVFKTLKENDIRAEIDIENKTVAKKILEATKMKIPYVLVVGGKEMKSKSVNVRDRAGKQRVIKLNQFIKNIQKEINDKK